MRPEDWERHRDMMRQWEQMRPSPEQMEMYRELARNAERLRPTPEQMRMYQDLARNAERLRPNLTEIESLRRQTELARELLNDPVLQQARLQATQIFEQRHRMVTQMPDEATRRQLAEAARYFNSREFQAQRDAILQATQRARQRLGSEGLAAAERISARHTATDGSQERGAERILAGEATDLLDEAAKLAASPEVRETIERADPEAILRLDLEEQASASAPEAEAPTESGGIETEVFEGEYPELTKEELLEMHTDALIVLWTLEAAFAPLAFSPAAPIFAPLAAGVGGLIALLSVSERVISRWED